VGFSLGRILKSVFRVSAAEFERMAGERYGFQEDMARIWQGFEPVAQTLVDGFHAALEDSRFKVLVPRLNAVAPELRGVAYEGAGMGLTLLDALLPWKKRLHGFLAGPGAHYAGLVYIGAGLVLPRMRRRPEPFLAQLDPVLGWLVVDGYGFYEGFFSGRRYVEEKAIPVHLSPYARRVFDQGLGRAIWFSTGANPDRIYTTIEAFPAGRRADIWSGIGLACAYAAGVVDRAAIETLETLAGPHRSQMAVGSAVAARFRLQSGNPAPHTDLACDVLWGRSSDAVAHITDLAMQDLPIHSAELAHEIWRKRIEAQFIEQAENAYMLKEAIS
jgi:enediyne biosynthesis protein E3